jgi:Dyp-type peroxidase family
MPAFTDEQLHNVQGFGIAGFRKDHQELVFVRFGDAKGGRKLLRRLQPRVSSAWEVGTFNEVFSEVRKRTGEEVLKATWVGVLISGAGYRALGVPLTGLPAGEGSTAFTAGMAARAAEINDTRPADAPAGWKPAFRPEAGVHMLIVVASDEIEDLAHEVTRVRDAVSACDAHVVFHERGNTLRGHMRGREHFGFRDGGSQPAVDGYNDPPQPGEPPVVPPGEFVLGYPDATGASPPTDPLWSDGSHVVFRRLLQDVALFRQQAAVAVPGADPVVAADQLAAKMIGRWPSGAPVELYPDADPGPGNESNAFQYDGDPEGQKCPRWAHIRKANPRNEPVPGPEDDPSLHRMLRRGIPFGNALSPLATSEDGKERGLHFFAVVADVARQFEIPQRRWLDDANFPAGQPASSAGGEYGPPAQGLPDGPDPVVGHHDAGAACILRQVSGEHPFPLLAQVIRVTAGEYFFLPSLAAITLLANGMQPPVA